MAESDNRKSASTLPDESRDPATEPPATTSKPLGDAIPTPREPGLDQPLPPKKRPEGDQSDKP